MAWRFRGALAWGAAIAVAAAAVILNAPRIAVADGPVADDPPPDSSVVSVESLLNVYAAGPSTSPPSDWIPGVGNIPAILINPPGGPPIVVPTAPAPPYTPWSPWKFPGSWIPTGPPAYPNGRIPGKIKWNPTRPGWDFVAPGLPPIPLSSIVSTTPVGEVPAELEPVSPTSPAQLTAPDAEDAP